MTMKMYSIKDKINGYTIPIAYPNHESARRHFEIEWKRNPVLMYSPEDFYMAYIGEFDDQTGIYENKREEIIANGNSNGETVISDSVQ